MQKRLSMEERRQCHKNNNKTKKQMLAFPALGREGLHQNVFELIWLVGVPS